MDKMHSELDVTASKIAELEGVLGKVFASYTSVLKILYFVI